MFLCCLFFPNVSYFLPIARRPPFKGLSSPLFDSLFSAPLFGSFLPVSSALPFSLTFLPLSRFKPLRLSKNGMKPHTHSEGTYKVS